MLQELLNRPIVRHFLKFAVIGGSSLLLDLGIYFVLTRYGHLPYLGGRAISLALAMVWNFTLNRSWTFRAQSGHVGTQASRFIIVMTITSLLNLLLMRVGVRYLHLNDILALLLVSMLITLVNFFAHRNWSYRML